MKKFRPLYLLFTVIALLLSFTSFYSVGYLVLIVIFALTMRFSVTFSSLFSKLIVATLLLLATTMIVALISWFLHAITYPIIVMAVFSLVTLGLNFKRGVAERTRTKLFDSGDILGAVVALIIPLVIAVSYFLPYSNASLYQLLSNGWDNTAHVVMLETASIEKTFVYGKLEDVQAKTINKTNAYPQAWHLATSNFANGFGRDLFNPEKPITVLKWYAVVMALWFMIGAFLVSKIAWGLSRKIRARSSLPTWLFVGLFITFNIVAQLLAGAGSMLNGFANYLGILAYAALLVSFIVDADPKRPNRSLLIAAFVTAVGGVLCWFLPFPAIILSALLLIVQSKPGQTVRGFLKGNKAVLTVAVVLGAAVLAQVIIFVKFTKETGAELLITNGGAYKVSELLVGLLILGTGVYLLKRQPDLFRKFLIAVCPLILMIVGLYAYQLIISEQLTYYYYKLTMLLGMVIMIFAIPALLVGFNYVFNKLGNSKSLAVIVFPTLIGLSLLITQQTLRPFHFLLQSDANVTYATATAAVHYLEYENPHDTKIIIMTNRLDETPIRDENFNGDLVSTVSHLPYTCAYRVFNNDVTRGVYQALPRLDRCADKTDHDILVVTNNNTYKLVKDLHKSNIRIVNVH